LRMPACTTSERERERATIWHTIDKLFIHKFNIVAVFTSPKHSTSILFTWCHVPEWVPSPHRRQIGLKCAVDYYLTFHLCSWRQVIKTHMNFGDSSY
jgi:hypothetical protein